MMNTKSVIFSNHTNNSELVENILIIGVNNQRGAILNSILKKEKNQIYTIESRALLSSPYTTVARLCELWFRSAVKDNFLITSDAMPFFLQPDATFLLLDFYRSARPQAKKIIAVADRCSDIPKQIIEYIPNIICLDKESRDYLLREIPTVTDERVL